MLAIIETIVYISGGSYFIWGGLGLIAPRLDGFLPVRVLTSTIKLQPRRYPERMWQGIGVGLIAFGAGWLAHGAGPLVGLAKTTADEGKDTLQMLGVLIGLASIWLGSRHAKPHEGD